MFEGMLWLDCEIGLKSAQNFMTGSSVKNSQVLSVFLPFLFDNKVC